MSRTIHCTVVEVSDMTDIFGSNSEGGFEDLVPWADPYIASLIDKLRAEAIRGGGDNDLVNELPPRETGGGPDHADWRPDWSPRNWPRRH